MSNYRWSQRSLDNLGQVHPDLVKLATKALDLSTVDFGVTEGARTFERQELLVDRGASWTLKSRHLLTSGDVAHAIDVAAYIDGEVRWDWPLYSEIYEAFVRAHVATGILFEWGGWWRGNQADGPHYQLPREVYP